MCDIRYSSSVYDNEGEITTFCGETELGRKWLENWGGIQIETSESALVIFAMRGDGLNVRKG